MAVTDRVSSGESNLRESGFKYFNVLHLDKSVVLHVSTIC